MILSVPLPKARRAPRGSGSDDDDDNHDPETTAWSAL